MVSCLPTLFRLASMAAPTPHPTTQASLHKIMGKEAKGRKGGMKAAQERGRGQEGAKARRGSEAKHSNGSSEMSEFRGSTAQRGDYRERQAVVCPNVARRVGFKCFHHEKRNGNYLL